MSTLLTWDRLPAVDVGRPGRALAAAGLLGGTFQGLFWDSRPGLAVPLFAVMVLAAVGAVAWSEGLRPARTTVLLGAVALVLAGGVAVRADPVTTAANVLVTAGLVGVALHAFASSRWLRYGLRDWLLAALRLGGHGLVGAPGFLRAARGDAGAPPHRFSRVAPLARGAVLAAPVVALLAVLLASADAVFAARLAALRVDLPQFDDLAGRVLLAAAVAYVAAGGLWHLARQRAAPAPVASEVPRVLGFTEAVVVLGSVNLLFAAFVAVQVRYLFGGQSALVAGGLTHAEYARRGFGELVAVAAVSLALHLALAGLARRESPVRRWVFTALAATLTVLVLVILASAFQRLTLYEQAFGFTRLRTVVHVFIVWLGFLLLAVLALELADRLRLFLVAGIVAAVGFAGTLNVVGVDALIARHNLARAAQGAELDLSYLAGLSPDAVPELVAGLPALAPVQAADVAGVAVCIGQRGAAEDWRGWRLADLRAAQALRSVPHRLPAGDPTASAAAPCSRTASGAR